MFHRKMRTGDRHFTTSHQVHRLILLWSSLLPHKLAEVPHEIFHQTFHLDHEVVAGAAVVEEAVAEVVGTLEEGMEEVSDAT